MAYDSEQEESTGKRARTVTQAVVAEVKNTGTSPSTDTKKRKVASVVKVVHDACLCVRLVIHVRLLGA